MVGLFNKQGRLARVPRDITGIQRQRCIVNVALVQLSWSGVLSVQHFHVGI